MSLGSYAPAPPATPRKWTLLARGGGPASLRNRSATQVPAPAARSWRGRTSARLKGVLGEC